MMTMRMNRTIVAALVLLLLQTAVIPWAIPSAWSDRLLPHLPFVMTMFVAAFAGRHRAFLFGLGFGLLEDTLSYGHMIGAYAFGMALLGYLVGLLAEQRTTRTLAFTLLMIGLGSGLLDLLVYFVYKLFLLTHLSVAYVVYWQVVPTLLLQTFAGLALYLPVRRWFIKTAAPKEEAAA
ncbi:rod shape-determining protein MreD [Cohnella sp. REN36]|uniref:rod shape-determining protein MreD n=1 Tax=Cohnella sp. REN36 TaxID=2887347 RepID=UPI001D143C9C|nr:rod shape-determining protein MreD [Cohnella sp. REN36]MCC3376908.1 rod shape-determining protein MreD [Cohnella sp. REN36]